MKKYLLTIAFFLPLLIAFGQNLKSSYIITLEGDTVHGFIDAKNWNMNPSIVNFKQSPEDEGVYYDPYDIKSFSIEGDHYEGGYVEVEQSSRDVRSLSTTPELFIAKKLVFLQQLTKGSRPLYVNGNEAYNQFYIKNDTTFELLVYKKYLKDVIMAGMTQTTIIENKKYQGQLKVYLGDCPEIDKYLARVDYELKSLKALFSKYYECINEEDNVLNPVRNFKASAGIELGYSLTSLDYNFNYNSKTEPENLGLMPVSVSLELTKPISMPRWSLFNDFGIAILQDYDIFQTFIQNDIEYSEKVNFDLNFMKMDNLVRYYFPLQKWSIFAEGGISNQLYIGGRESILNAYILGVPVNHRSNEFLTKWVHRATIGTGIVRNKFSFEIRFGAPVKKTFAGSITSFTLGYRFKSRE